MSARLLARISVAPLVLGGLLGALLVALLATALALGGFPVVASLRALVGGSVGSWDAVLSATLVRATPLLLTGLAVSLAFRAGVMNIGAEGQLLAGAAAAAVVGGVAVPVLGSLTLPVELAAAVTAGCLWSVVPSWLRQRFGDEQFLIRRQSGERREHNNEQHTQQAATNGVPQHE